MRVAVTLEQCWHRVPGGTAVAALEVARRLRPVVEQVGVAAYHRRPAAPPFEPPAPPDAAELSESVVSVIVTVPL